MIALGLILVLAGAAVGLDIVFRHSHRIENVPPFGLNMGIHSVTSVFFLGLLTGAAILLGVALLLAGTRRQGSRVLSRHREHRELHSTQQTAESLQTENQKLRQRLASRSGSTDPTPEGNAVIEGKTRVGNEE